jgi:hypothetical protein
MTGNGTAHGHAIPTFAPRTMVATSPERVQIDGDALPEGATPAEKAAIMRGLVIRHPHGTVHALLGAPPGRVLCAHTRLPAWRGQMARHLSFVVCSDEQRHGAWHAAVRRLDCWAVPVPTLNRALVVLNKVCPALVFTDAALTDGRAGALIRALRAVPALEEVYVVVLGRVTPDEGYDLAGAP